VAVKRSEERTHIEEYKAKALREAKPGYGADGLPRPDEDKRQVRQNVKIAAASSRPSLLDFQPDKVEPPAFSFITPGCTWSGET